MRMACPACNAEMSLEVAIGREADARALAEFIDRNVPLGAAIVRYLALFRPPKRRLGMARMVSLFGELQPDIDRAAVARKGRDWAAPRETWMAAIEQVLANRDKGTIKLPLSSHGYLYEVIVAIADKAEAQSEREREQERRTNPPRGPVSIDGPVGINAVLHGPVSAPESSSNAPAKPSRAAIEIRAQMERAKRGRTADDEDEST